MAPSTSSRFDAGSVLTSSTRFPASARATAVALATEVLPTPPLPVKNRLRGTGWPRIIATPPWRNRTWRTDGHRHRLRARAATGAAGRFRRALVGYRADQADKPRQLRPFGIPSPGGNLPVHENQGKTIVAEFPERSGHHRIRGERRRLLGQVITLDVDPLALEPVEVRREPRQHRIDRGAADARRAAHGGIEHAELRHFIPPSLGSLIVDQR